MPWVVTGSKGDCLTHTQNYSQTLIIEDLIFAMNLKADGSKCKK